MLQLLFTQTDPNKRFRVLRWKRGIDVDGKSITNTQFGQSLAKISVLVVKLHYVMGRGLLTTILDSDRRLYKVVIHDGIIV
jgi:hypothetical protein